MYVVFKDKDAKPEPVTDDEDLVVSGDGSGDQSIAGMFTSPGSRQVHTDTSMYRLTICL